MEITYDAWGNFTDTVSTMEYPPSTEQLQALATPFRYRGYYYDQDTGLYYLNSRYYDASLGRFISADNQISGVGGDTQGYNLYAYCDNNPVMRVDYTGEAWWHWAVAATIVVACAVATVVTCGGFAAAATAVCLVGSGVAAATTASTVAAAAFIGSAVALGTAAIIAADSSDSLEEFADQGDLGTITSVALSAGVGGLQGYDLASSTQNSLSSNNDGYNLDGAKGQKYLEKRGWSDQTINEAINNGKKGISINMANQKPCTVYVHPSAHNSYVVIENDSRSLVQLSEFGNPNWIPDSRIIWGP